MLSTISSFLPAALSDKLDKLELRSDDSTAKQQAADGNVKRRDMAEETNKKEKKKKSSSNETFIVVRPPPAKSNHPLNLQLQLVPAHHSRDRSNTSAATTPTGSRFSIDQGLANDPTQPAAPTPPSPSASESEHALKRIPSNRSSRSETSAFYASSTAAAGSVTSFASTTSTSSARRMIIPLYNLSAHNVMTNTILDAGTDARVAKFLKRGLEIIDLAILEPTEVWCGKDHAHGAGVGAASDPLGVPIHRSASGNSSLAPPGQNGSRAATPDPSYSPGSSRLSISSDHSNPGTHHPTVDHASTPTATPTGAKKLFGRIFRKRESSSGGGGHPRSATVATVAPAASSPPRPVTPISEPPKTHTNEVLLPAVLGLSPTLSASSNPPTGRCVSYVWVVRKWLKVEPQGLISGMIGKIGREASAHGIGGAGVPEAREWEVRFEWTRSKIKTDKARKAKRRTSADAGAAHGSQTPSRRNSTVVGSDDIHEPSHAGEGLAISIDSPRQSLDVKRSAARTPSPGRGASTAISVTSTSDDDGPGGNGDNAGDDSDPEDSETPWTCSMILSHASTPLSPPASLFRKGHSRTRTMSSSQPAATSAPKGVPAFISESGHDSTPAHVPVKVKVATLSPAPHHPKVVCQLKIPYPLPDAEVEHGLLRKRLVLADGSTRSTIPAGRGPEAQTLILTAEEIKDVVCSTAFWVVVREGFGGVGKKNRKGDGWKIRG